jgi:hypothetical protein
LTQLCNFGNKYSHPKYEFQGKQLSQRFDYIMKHLSNASTTKKVDKPKKKKRPEASQPKKKKSSVTKNIASKTTAHSNGGATSEKHNRPIKEVRYLFSFHLYMLNRKIYYRQNLAFNILLVKLIYVSYVSCSKLYGEMACLYYVYV